MDCKRWLALVADLCAAYPLLRNFMIRLLCTDFDGTIFDDTASKPISERFLQFVKNFRDNGGKWVISTGRDCHEMVATLEHYNIPVWPDYLSVVEREIYSFDDRRYVSLEPWNQRCKQVHDDLYHRLAPLLPALEDWIVANYSDSILYKDGYSPLCFIAKDNPEADVVLSRVKEHLASVQDVSLVRNDVYARLAHKDYHKGATLKELERVLNINAEDVCVAGDHYNDLPMLQKQLASYIITPANAIDLVKDTVKEQGGYISKNAFGDGVVEGILVLSSK